MIDSRNIFDQPVKNNNMATQEYMINLKHCHRPSRRLRSWLITRLSILQRKLETYCDRFEKTTSP